MQINDSSTSPHNSIEPHMPLDAVERMLQQKLCNNIAPFALEVDCPGLLSWAEHWQEPGYRHQNLVRELRIWSAYLSRRPLARTFIHEPFQLMDAPALTELVYAIGQNFKLLHGHHVEHGAKLNHQDLTRQNLGLLKGLEFNHICLKISGDFDLQELRVHRQMLNDFKFTFFSLELDFDSSSQDFLISLMELLSFIQPASVSFSQHIKAPFATVDRDGLTALLMQFGYFSIDAGAALLTVQSPLHKRPRDTVRLGPGFRSRFGTLSANNFASPIQFGERLDQSLLPTATCF